jgi:tetratricopeptide (TPR) repeat protein
MTTSELSWYQVPETTKDLLRSAAQTWENTSESEQYIREAIAECDDNLDVLVAAYRYFFYKHNDAMALQVSQKVVDRIKALEHLPDDWEQLRLILRDRQDNPNIRLYLNAYAASGLVLARLGETEKAKEITERIKEFDEKHEFGASVVFDILTNPIDEDDDE